MRPAPRERAVSSTCSSMGRPARGCSTFGRSERMRLPWPAARMTTFMTVRCLRKVEFYRAGPRPTRADRTAFQQFAQAAANGGRGRSAGLTGQDARSHEELVDGPGALAPLAYRPDHQGLAASHIAGGEDPGYAGGIAVGIRPT